jgi:hypothetical protein
MSLIVQRQAANGSEGVIYCGSVYQRNGRTTLSAGTR